MITRDKKDFYRTGIFFLFNIIEGIIAILVTASISADPKNAVIFGLSKSRFAFLAIAGLVVLAQVAFLLSSKWMARLECYISDPKRAHSWLTWLGIFSLSSLWVTIWFPAQRLAELAALFTRFQPMLVWVELMLFQFYLYARITRHEVDFGYFVKFFRENKKIIFWALALAAVLLIVFLALRFLGSDKTENQYYFPPSAPFSAIEIIFSLLLFVILKQFESRSGNNKTPKWVSWFGFFFFWVVTASIWGSTPLACSDDRLGPFPPNNICYPSINDAVYSIGSHYITLGQGIYHHWLTDKPLYMAFLALSQWLLGPSIDKYILLQVVLIAMIPAILFLLGKKYFGLSGGVFAGLLSILAGENAILLYTKVSGINVWFENPELLVALLLILFCLVVVKWFEFPNRHYLAAAAGALFGAALLTRYNPVFIAPVILLVFIVVFRKYPNVLWRGILAFVIAFLLVFSPWMISARDSNGKNYYLTKIEDVLISRYSIGDRTNNDNTPPAVEPEAQQTIPSTVTLNYKDQPVDSSGLGGIVYHFLNNEYQALGILPVNFTILSNSDQVAQPIWDLSESRPFWKAEFSIENLILLFVNLGIFLIGILSLFKKFGVIGLIPLIIQISYHFGNAFAKTSGGRYMQPVNWVTYLYIVAGLVALLIFLMNLFRKEKFRLNMPVFQKEDQIHPVAGHFFGPKQWGVLGLALLLGMVLPILNMLPNQLPVESGQDVTQTAAQTLVNAGVVTEEQWQNFIGSPNSLVVQGAAYHASYFRSKFYNIGDPGLETMVLGQKHVLVSYLFMKFPQEKLSDGSNVILVGCKIGQDSLWGANRIILRSYALIQTDNEASLLLDSKANWTCP